MNLSERQARREAGAIESVERGARASGVVEYLGEALERENAAIDAEAFRHIDANTLTGEIASHLWLRRFEIRRLVRRLAGDIQAGRNAGSDHPAAVAKNPT